MLKKLEKFSFAGLLVAVLAAPSFAQNGNYKIDSNHSTARLTAASSRQDVPEFPIGVAKVSGTVNVDRAVPSLSVFNFTIQPSARDAHDAQDYASISFKSTRVVPASDGTVEVTGDLTVTRVTHEMVLDANEGYSGPQYSDAVKETTTREVAFVVGVPTKPSSEAAENADPIVSASTVIDREDFPNLYTAVVDGNWPAFGQGGNCVTPSTTGEDYSGTVCTGTLVDANRQPEVSNTVGEDYPGPAIYHPLGNQVKLSLNLHLVPAPSQSSANGGN
jgi:polyisoprenoid-binding protein YceI